MRIHVSTFSKRLFFKASTERDRDRRQSVSCWCHYELATRELACRRKRSFFSKCVAFAMAPIAIRFALRPMSFPMLLALCLSLLGARVLCVCMRGGVLAFVCHALCIYLYRLFFLFRKTRSRGRGEGGGADRYLPVSSFVTKARVMFHVAVSVW